MAEGMLSVSRSLSPSLSLVIMADASLVWSACADAKQPRRHCPAGHMILLLNCWVVPDRLQSHR